MRPYQDWLRNEIRDRREATVAEQNEIERALAAIESDTSLGEEQSLLMRIELGERRAVLNHEEAGLRFELRVRDSPEMTAQFGPGRD